MAKTLGDLVAEARRQIREVDVETLDDWLRSRDDVLVVDVREMDEFHEGHIPGALLVPRGTLEGAADPGYKHRHPILCNARDRPVVLCCASGGRAALATATLQTMGFEEVYNLSGGFELWEAEGLPVES